MKAFACSTLIATVLLVGCAPPVVTLKSTFDPKAAAYIKSQGGAAIEGQAFLRQRGGGVITAAGSKVLLMPVTDFTQEIVLAASTGHKVIGITPQAEEYIRSTQADAEGRFKFEKLGPGAYYLLTEVIWEVPYGRYATPIRQGGVLVQQVQLAGGERKSVIMSGT